MSAFAFFSMTVAVLLVGDVSKSQVRDERKLQGWWQIQAAEAKGQMIDEPELGELGKWQLVFKGNRLIVHYGDGSEKESAVYLAEAGKHHAMDLVGLSGPDQGMISKGIWRFEGERLRLCYNNKPGDNRRPQQFKTTADSEFMMIVLKRQESSSRKKP